MIVWTSDLGDEARQVIHLQLPLRLIQILLVAFDLTIGREEKANSFREEAWGGPQRGIAVSVRIG